MKTNITTTTTNHWTTILEAYCIQDPNAPTSILTYYLNNIPDYCGIFCPLGYKPYEKAGQAMWDDPDAFDAALSTGLMCSAISTHIGASLDVWENWDFTKPGVLYLRSHPELSRHISVRDKFYIDALKDIEDEDEWYATVERIQNQLDECESKGY